MRRAALVLLLAAGLGLGGKALPGRTPAITGPSAVLEPVEIGGMAQKLLIRGQDRTAPVLPWLQGGPRTAQMPLGHATKGRLSAIALSCSGSSAVRAGLPGPRPDGRGAGDAGIDAADVWRAGSQHAGRTGHRWLDAARVPTGQATRGLRDLRPRPPFLTEPEHLSETVCAFAARLRGK